MIWVKKMMKVKAEKLKGYFLTWVHKRNKDIIYEATVIFPLESNDLILDKKYFSLSTHLAKGSSTTVNT